jgi:hypothetical protein
MHTKRLALATVSLAAALSLAVPLAFAQGTQGAPGARQTADPARTGGYLPLKDTLNVAQADMRRLLEKHGAIGARPIEYLSPEEARKVPSIADAVKALLRDGGGKYPDALMAQTGVFFGTDAVVSDAGRAQDYAAKELREALAAANRTGSTNRPRQ